MTGLIYKEMRQNRNTLWFAGFMAPLCLLCFLGMVLLGSLNPDLTFRESYADMSADGDLPLPMILTYCCFVPFLTTGLLSLNIFAQDETKKWGYFTASHPKGIQGAVYAKYVLIFLMSIITFVSVTFTEELVMLLDHLILGKKAEEMVSYAGAFPFLVFIQIFLRMIDIPFIIRFGKKRGESVKIMVIGGLFIGAIVYALFGPLPGEDGEFFIRVYDWWETFKAGAAQDWIYWLLAGFLWLTIFGYYLSYRLSCKLYMKGVEQYDK